MDEPLSALDKNLREQMQIEIRNLHQKLEMTTVYVTHDQREALTMSDRIAVINDGKIIQLDDPQTLYEKPKKPLCGAVHRRIPFSARQGIGQPRHVWSKHDQACKPASQLCPGSTLGHPS